METFELLAGTAIATGMSAEQVQALATHGVRAAFANGEPLVEFDDPGFDLLVVLSGACEITTRMGDVLYRLGAGSLIGEMSFVDHRSRSANAISVGACEVVRFPASLIEDLETTRPDIAVKVVKNICIVLTQKLRSTTRFAEASFV